MINAVSILKEAKSIVCLDIETVLDTAATGLLPGREVGKFERSALHRIRAASVLAVEINGAKSAASVRSWNDQVLPEDTMIGEIADHLQLAGKSGSTLLTFYGRSHDLPALRRRAARHLIFRIPGLTTWDDGDWPHLDLTDLQAAAGKRTALDEAAAGFGIAVPDRPKGRTSDTAMAKSQIDVALTFLVFLYERAIWTNDGRSLLEGWRALGRAIDADPSLRNLNSLRKPAGLGRL